MSVCRDLCIGLCWFCTFGVNAAVQVEQPRAFGYVIGDVLEQRLALPTNASVELPPIQRVGLWLERVSATVLTSDTEQHWLLLKYQIINSPMEAMMITLPALRLTLSDGTDLVADAWPISVSPLAADSDVLPIMRPNRQPALADTGEAERQYRTYLSLLVIMLLGWLGWWRWRGYTEARRLPFARALAQLRKLGLENVDENPQAWYLLHHALNDAAGRTINHGTITELVQDKPWLASLHSRIEAFYAASSTRFFEQAGQPQSFALVEFCAQLYQAEKQHSGGYRQATR